MMIVENRMQGAAIMLDAAELAAVKDELVAVAEIVNRTASSFSAVYADVRQFGDLPALAALADSLQVRS
jgi:hypothetical protein